MTDPSQGSGAGMPPELWLDLYRRMLTIRHFEEAVNDLYRSARMPGLAHLYTGEEAVAVGVCGALRDDDYITSTHRGHGHCLAKGAAPDRMFAELLGKEAGYCRGKGGSMHIADQERGNLGANAIVAGSSGIATGAALSARRRGTDQVAACFFGDGALGQGLLYEAMNMASLWRLPVIYICENNLYNEYTPMSETTAGDVAARPQSFGIPVRQVDGQDLEAVFQAAGWAVTRARAGEGPSFLLCSTYRYHGHHVGDVDRSYYRAKEEERRWREEKDPVQLAARRMAELGIEPSALERVDEEASTRVREGVQFALAAPYPEPQEVTQDVYA
ncbi:MAG: thiamine pyrophosphate-dependent dehydrogenase E1 component subunit alpha [Candidatus Dormibacterales bacterium]